MLWLLLEDEQLTHSEWDGKFEVITGSEWEVRLHSLLIRFKVTEPFFRICTYSFFFSFSDFVLYYHLGSIWVFSAPNQYILSLKMYCKNVCIKDNRNPPT